MSAYAVTVETLTEELLTNVGEFFTEDKANHEAVKASRMFTAPNYVAVVRCSDAKRGYPKAYRMGRLYRPLA